MLTQTDWNERQHVVRVDVRLHGAPNACIVIMIIPVDWSWCCCGVV